MADFRKPSGLQKRILREGILETFDRSDLEIMLSDNLEVKFANVVGAGTYEKQVFDLIEWMVRRAKLGRLIDAVTAQRPELAKTLSMAAAPTVATATPSSLERLIRSGEGIDRFSPMLARFLALEGQVCRIEVTSSETFGTGFLVAPDLVLTNFHVIEPEIAGNNYDGIVCRFDYLSESARGTAVRPAADKCCLAYARYSAEDAKSDGGTPQKSELDYALIKLSRPVGDDRMDDKGRTRGTVATSASAVVPPGQKIVFIAQHPESAPLSASWGLSLGPAAEGMRFRYTAETLGGSSGSPVFDGDLSLIALHHAGEPGSKLQPGAYNQGIPISLIVADLAGKQITPFWE